MNFFGHAVVASWEQDDPRFVLGAMLPDFASMCRDRIAGVDSPMVRRGIEHHHRADAIFHQLEWFRVRMRRLSHGLRVAGIRRGPALGAAHVGIELALDTALVDSGHDTNSFSAALSAADPDAVHWQEAGTDERFAELLDRLRTGSPAADARELARRVRGTLRHRPRLALQEAEMPALESAMGDQLDELRQSAADLLRAMEIRLRAG